MKPTLTIHHRIARLQWVISKVVHGDRSFDFDLEWIHVDEKWFYMTRKKRKVRLFPGEGRVMDETTHHKSHIAKVMFLAAVGVPHWLPNGDWFDGRIGMWAFMEEVAAKRNSVNRAAGTIEWKPVNVDSAEYLDMMTKNGGVLQAVRQKFAVYARRPVVIQHDGATPHTGKGNSELLDIAGGAGGHDISFQIQPAQSPDLNKLDLCLFASLQARSHILREETNSMPDLIQAVRNAWANYSATDLIRVEALKYVVYREILKSEGGNQYDIPHSGIRQRERAGEEVIDRSVDPQLVAFGRNTLNHLLTLV